MVNPLTPQQEAALVAAIRQAEVTTSGEIRVHFEDTCPTPEPLDRAAQIFAQLNMQETAERNGVLFYVAWETRQFAIIGDAGINSAVPDDFWETTKEIVLDNFRTHKFVLGLERGIQMVGEQLQRYFPYNVHTDQNELDDSISFGDATPPRI
jgi:uncharacterized membrane protein